MRCHCSRCGIEVTLPPKYEYTIDSLGCSRCGAGPGTMRVKVTVGDIQRADRILAKHGLKPRGTLSPAELVERYAESHRLLIELANAHYGGNLLASAILRSWQSYVADFEATRGEHVPMHDPFLIIEAKRMRWGNLLELEPRLM